MTIHSCGYHCQIPACIKAQRDELVEKYIAMQDIIFMSPELKNLESLRDGYKKNIETKNPYFKKFVAIATPRGKLK